MATIKKVDDGKYLVRYDVYENGVRKQRNKTFARAKDAKAFAAEVENNINKGQYASSKGQTLEQYLNDWLELYTSNIRPNTRADYKNSLAKHVIPNLGKIKLENLTPTDVQKFYNSITKTTYRPAKCDDAGKEIEPACYYSANTVTHIHRALNKALGKAVKLHYIPFNPASDATLPSVTVRQIAPPTPKQLSLLLESMEGDALYPAILACALLGVRRGEALGISNADVDLENGTITLRRSLTINNENHKVELTELKTQASCATLPMPPILATAIKNKQKQNKLDRIAHADIYVTSDLIFVDEAGFPNHPTNVSKVFKKYAKQAGLEMMRLHDLRHAYATYLIDGGASVKTVQSLLRHADAKTTLNMYASAIDESMSKATAIMESIYFSSKN